MRVVLEAAQSGCMARIENTRIYEQWDQRMVNGMLDVIY